MSRIENEMPLGANDQCIIVPKYIMKVKKLVIFCIVVNQDRELLTSRVKMNSGLQWSKRLVIQQEPSTHASGEPAMVSNNFTNTLIIITMTN